MEAAQHMQKLVKQLCTLLEPCKAELIDFEDLVGNYTRKKADKAASLLDILQEQSILTYQREDYGFRINVLDMQQLKNFPSTAMDKEA